ncbi:MAG TPA: carboxypeptidase-like regulatory domain-containing protein [Clostridia bacterium]|nr:carboxypeptidase-like regulatory domain-containing protein [Clostridia bacterium]
MSNRVRGNLRAAGVLPMMKRIALIVSLLLVLGLSAFGGDDKVPPSSADLQFTVVKATNGKPVRNASVILHTLSEGKQDKGGVQVKTDAEGKTMVPAMPFGKLRVQVIARGFQTFGEDYEIKKPKHEFTIKLQPPKEQFSIYK